MSVRIFQKGQFPERAGMTLTELVVAMGLAFLVAAAVMTLFIWGTRTSVQTAKVLISQNRAIVTSEVIAQYLRNATRVVAMDEENGTWVRVQFSDGSFGTLTYSNNMPQLRDGRLFLVRSNSVVRLVTRGLTGAQTSEGFSPNFFFCPRPNLLRIRYRITDPVTEEGREVINDGAFASSVDLWICLRNAEGAIP